MKIAVAADLHLRGDRPLCRTDSDWIDTQRNDLRSLFKAAEGCDELWIVGDVFHTPRVSTECVNMALREFIDARTYYDYTIHILAGNHDLPEHNYDNLDRCSLGVMLKVFPELNSDKYTLDWSDEGAPSVSAHPFGHDDMEEADRSDVWATHQLTFPDDSARPFPDLGRTAQELLDMAPHCRVVMTGDYHRGYVHHGADGRIVVTPGCMNVQVADMADYEPRIYVVDTETTAVEERRLGTNREGTVRTDYLDEEKARSEAIEAAANITMDAGAVKLDFRGNLETLAERAGDACKGVIRKVLDAINGDRQ